MSMETQLSKEELASLIQHKTEELVKLVSLQKFGPDGPPRQITFSQIEDIGHEIGQATAAAVDQDLQQQHAQQHFHDDQPCPTCQQLCQVNERERTVLTRTGPVVLVEPICYCQACDRSFFPSALHPST